MKIKIKKLRSDAGIPCYAHPTDAGMDLTANSVKRISTELIEYGSGIAVEIPEGYVGLVFPRSSVFKTNMNLTNCVGVIDSGYRGEIKAKFRFSSESKVYQYGERFAQLLILPYPKVEFIEVECLSDSDRGTGGYGSTGK